MAASEEREGCDGDCAACSYLLAAQGAYYEAVNLPGKQVAGRYSVNEPKSFHDNRFIENLARAPPFFIV
jgi:hypothetical protein